MAIYFYGQAAKWGELSNFARFSFMLNGRHWPTSQHYFQAMKYEGTRHEEEVRRAKTPSDAAMLGQILVETRNGLRYGKCQAMQEPGKIAGFALQSSVVLWGRAH